MGHDHGDHADHAKRSYTAGKQLFTVANCVGCHKLDNAGKEFGPDLSKLDVKLKPSDILKELLDPSAKINEKYQTNVFELQSGKVIQGLVVEESGDIIKVVENPLISTTPPTPASGGGRRCWASSASCASSTTPKTAAMTRTASRPRRMSRASGVSGSASRAAAATALPSSGAPVKMSVRLRICATPARAKGSSEDSSTSRRCSTAPGPLVWASMIPSAPTTATRSSGAGGSSSARWKYATAPSGAPREIAS
ncbi:MAG: c-type cytochrome [Baekduiaceae bacterium]